MKQRGRVAIDAAIAEVRSIYEELARRPVERACVRRTECCHFKLTGRTPYLTKGEALLAAKALRSTGRTRLPGNSDSSCPLLHPMTRDCLIYADRPFGCRTHFCAAAGGPHTRGEVGDLIHRLEDIAGGLDETEARPLPAAMAAALEEFR